MAHFPKLNEENIVDQIIVISNSDSGDLEFPESESIGQDFIKSIGLDGNWKQTSYNGNFRKRYAGLNDVYDETRDAFIPPKPYSSYILNEETCLWEPPIPRPEDGKLYQWNEDILNWEEVIIE